MVQYILNAQESELFQKVELQWQLKIHSPELAEVAVASRWETEGFGGGVPGEASAGTTVMTVERCPSAAALATSRLNSRYAWTCIIFFNLY